MLPNSNQPEKSKLALCAGAATPVNKGRLDLTVLRYMARRVCLALREEITTPPPSLFYCDERHGRVHRIAIYAAEALQGQSELAFVGFISKKRQPLAAEIMNDIHNVDGKLIAELVGVPGILSYSSLELCSGHWYNLVVFNNALTKMHIKDSATHQYAAYQLAPHYYEWIRLHNGRMPAGLVSDSLILQKTKLYTFHVPGSRPSVHEHHYTRPVNMLQGRTEDNPSLEV